MKSSARVGICKLCRTEQPLCKSHIIPEFFYKPLYDNNHRFQRLSTEEGQYRAYEQKGIREYLLCSSCEGKFSIFERYASLVYFGGEEISIAMVESEGLVCRVDYNKLKLFQLSLLWRVGVATHSDFSGVTLGEHEAVLRKMLLAEEPGRAEEYGCITIWPLSYREIFDEIIMSAGMVDFGTTRASKLIVGGMSLYQFLAASAIDSRQGGLFLQEDGELRILVTDIIEKNYVERLAGELFQSNVERFKEN